MKKYCSTVTITCQLMFRNDDPSHYYCFVEGLTKALRTLWYSELETTSKFTKKLYLMNMFQFRSK